MKIEEAKIEELKVGDTYNVRVKVVDIDDDTDEIITETVNENGYSLGFEWCYYAPGEALAFSPITTTPTPKYDPCRLLKKGDRVQVKRRNGRCNGKDGEYLREAYCYVAENEVPNELVRVYHNSSEYRLDPAYLELVTPVEELEPYLFAESENSYDIFRKKNNGHQLRASFWWKHNPTPELLEMTKEEAHAAAKEECKRLNEKYRKENQ